MPAETHMTGEPLSRDDVLALVREQIGEIGAVPESTVTPDAHLAADLGIDATALLDVVAALEDELGERTVGVAIDDDMLRDVMTVGDLLDIVAVSLGIELPS